MLCACIQSPGVCTITDILQSARIVSFILIQVRAAHESSGEKFEFATMPSKVLKASGGHTCHHNNARGSYPVVLDLCMSALSPRRSQMSESASLHEHETSQRMQGKSCGLRGEAEQAGFGRLAGWFGHGALWWEGAQQGELMHA